MIPRDESCHRCYKPKALKPRWSPWALMVLIYRLYPPPSRLVAVKAGLHATPSCFKGTRIIPSTERAQRPFIRTVSTSATILELLSWGWRRSSGAGPRKHQVSRSIGNHLTGRPATESSGRLLPLCVRRAGKICVTLQTTTGRASKTSHPAPQGRQDRYHGMHRKKGPWRQLAGR